MYKAGQLVRSKIAETVYIILADCGYYYHVRVLASFRFTQVGHYMNLTKEFDGELLANNYRIK